MEHIKFEVENVVVPIETIMVHFQGGDSPEANAFTLVVPSTYVKEVFDPHGNCPSGTRLDAYVKSLISEMGTFITQGYLRGIRRLLGKEMGAFHWVIATIDEVSETDTEMLLRGKVVPFIPWLEISKR
jgi:hypothetical protein